MDVEEFVKDILAQITRSVNNNKDGGDIIYNVDYEKGVDFDLAVTTAESYAEDKGVKGGLKIQVVGIEGSKGKTSSNTVSQSSRVQFNVNLRREQNVRVGKMR